MVNGRPPPRRPVPDAPAPKEGDTLREIPKATIPPVAPPELDDTEPRGVALPLSPEAMDTLTRGPESTRSRGARPRPAPRLPIRRSQARDEKSGKGPRAVLLLLLLFAAGGGAGYWWLTTHAPAAPAFPVGPSPAVGAAAAFQEGKNLAREGNWQQAKARFDQAAALDPQLPGLDSYLARSAVEIPNQLHLAAAIAAVEKEQLGLAAAELKKVSDDTVQGAPLDRARKRLDEAVAAKLVEGRGLAATPGNLAAQKKLEASMDDLLSFKPDDRDVRTLRDQALEAIARLTHRPVEEKGPEGPGPWVEVAERFKSGDVGGAFAMANACADKEPACRTLVGQVTEFQDLNRRVEGLDPRELERLVRLDVAVCGGGTAARGARTRLATQYYKMASSANQTA